MLDHLAFFKEDSGVKIFDERDLKLPFALIHHNAVRTEATMCDTVAVHLLKNVGQLHDYSSREVDFVHPIWQFLMHDASERDLGLTMKQEVDARIILDDVH